MTVLSTADQAEQRRINRAHEYGRELRTLSRERALRMLATLPGEGELRLELQRLRARAEHAGRLGRLDREARFAQGELEDAAGFCPRPDNEHEHLLFWGLDGRDSARLTLGAKVSVATIFVEDLR